MEQLMLWEKGWEWEYDAVKSFENDAVRSLFVATLGLLTPLEIERRRGEIERGLKCSSLLL